MASRLFRSGGGGSGSGGRGGGGGSGGGSGSGGGGEGGNTAANREREQKERELEREREAQRLAMQLQERESGFLGPATGRSGAAAVRTRTPPPPLPKGDLVLKTNHLTPNGLIVLIYLEELLETDENLFYLEIERVNLLTRENQSPEFLELNPSGKIPVLIDKLRDNFAVFESAAILLYLEQNIDKKKAFSYDLNVHPKEYSSMVQWVMWSHGNLGPTQTQAHFYRNYCPEDVPFAKKKSMEDTTKIYDILNNVLENREWLVDGPKGPTIADINAFPWIRLHRRAGIMTLQHWPRLQAWFSRMTERTGVHSAIRRATEIGEDRTPL